MRGRLSVIEASRPKSVAELLDLMAVKAPPVPIAGGTDIMVRLEAGLQGGESYVDLSGLAGELRAIRHDPGFVELGALTTFWDARVDPVLSGAFPLLVEAAATVGAVQIQSRGTWVGNIANGSPAADGVAALLACDAELTLKSRGGERSVPLHGFFTGYKQLDLRPGEIIAAIRLPRRDPELWHAFYKIGTRQAQAITKVGLIVLCRADGTHRVIGTSVAPFVTRYPVIEALLDAGRALSRAEVHAVVAAQVHPIDDIRSTAAYRLKVFERLLWSEMEAHGMGAD